MERHQKATLNFITSARSVLPFISEGLPAEYPWEQHKTDLGACLDPITAPVAEVTACLKRLEDPANALSRALKGPMGQNIHHRAWKILGERAKDESAVIKFLDLLTRVWDALVSNETIRGILQSTLDAQSKKESDKFTTYLDQVMNILCKIKDFGTEMDQIVACASVHFLEAAEVRPRWDATSVLLSGGVTDIMSWRESGFEADIKDVCDLLVAGGDSRRTMQNASNNFLRFDFSLVVRFLTTSGDDRRECVAARQQLMKHLKVTVDDLYVNKVGDERSFKPNVDRSALLTWAKTLVNPTSETTALNMIPPGCHSSLKEVCSMCERAATLTCIKAVSAAIGADAGIAFGAAKISIEFDISTISSVWQARISSADATALKAALEQLGKNGFLLICDHQSEVACKPLDHEWSENSKTVKLPFGLVRALPAWITVAKQVIEFKTQISRASGLATAFKKMTSIKASAGPSFKVAVDLFASAATLVQQHHPDSAEMFGRSCQLTKSVMSQSVYDLLQKSCVALTGNLSLGLQLLADTGYVKKMEDEFHGHTENEEWKAEVLDLIDTKGKKFRIAWQQYQSSRQLPQTIIDILEGNGASGIVDPENPSPSDHAKWANTVARIVTMVEDGQTAADKTLQGIKDAAHLQGKTIITMAVLKSQEGLEDLGLTRDQAIEVARLSLSIVGCNELSQFWLGLVECTTFDEVLAAKPVLTSTSAQDPSARHQIVPAGLEIVPLDQPCTPQPLQRMVGPGPLMFVKTE
jgi:hypothetical protein